MVAMVASKKNWNKRNCTPGQADGLAVIDT